MHFAVMVPLVMAAPTAAVPLRVTVATLLAEDETAEETEEAEEVAAEDKLLELNVPVAEDTLDWGELDCTELAWDELEAALEARLLTLAADEVELLDTDDDDEDFLLSLSLQLTRSAANKIPASGLI